MAPRCAGTSTPSSPGDRWSAGARIACSSWCTTATRTRRAATRARTASTSPSAAEPRSAPPGEPVSPEPQAAQIAIGIVVDGVPVVDELGEQAHRLRADDVGEAQREIRVRLVEAAVVARDRREGGRLLAARRRRLDRLRDEEVRVREDAVEVLVGDGRLRRGEIDRVPAEGLGDLVGVQPPVLPDAGLELRSCRTQGRRAANGRYVARTRKRPYFRYRP